MINRIFRSDAIMLLSWKSLLGLSVEQRNSILSEVLSYGDDESNEDNFLINEELNNSIVDFLKEDFSNVTNEFLESKIFEFFSFHVVVVGTPEIYEPCVCCGFRTIKTRGQYYICKVCFWEDDGQLEIEKYSVVNKLTLKQGIVNFETFGVSNPKYKEHVTKEPSKYLRID